MLHCEGHTSEKAHKGIHPGFETQGRCYQKSKTGVSVASRKVLVSSKDLNKHNWRWPSMCAGAILNEPLSKILPDSITIKIYLIVHNFWK